MQSLRQCPTLCDSVACGLSGFPVREGLLQARILECIGQYWLLYPALFSSVQSLSHVWLFVTPWIVACQASLSSTNSWSWVKLMPIEWWCHPAISSSVVPSSSCPQPLPASTRLENCISCCPSRPPPEHLVLPESLQPKQLHHLHPWPSQGQTQVLQGSLRSKPQWTTHMQRWR